MRRFERVDLGYEAAVTLVTGDSSVVVVYVNALGTSQSQWDDVLAQLSGHTTITYDRAGIGASSPLPPHLRTPRTLGDLAEELRTLLNNLGVDTPPVLVGHSKGGLIALMYATRYPTHTAGLVLVDSTVLSHLEVGHWPDSEDGDGSSRLDLTRSQAELPTGQWPSIPAVVVASAIGRWLRLTPDEAEEYAPLTIEQVEERWQQGQRLLATNLDALLVIADHAGHDIPSDQPALISASIDAVVGAIKTGSPVTIPDSRLHAAGGTSPAG